MDIEIYKKIKNNIDNLSKPLDGLGSFEDMIARMGAILKDESVVLDKKALLVFVADNGIIEEGVSQSDESVTLSVAKQLAIRNTSVCQMASVSDVDVLVYDMGIKIREKIEGVNDDYFVSAGTKNFLMEPAMSNDECLKAINYGRQIARDKIKDGYKALLLGEMGIGNTSTSSAVIASLLKLKSEDICGRGAGLSDQGLARKIDVINKAIDKYDLYNAGPFEVLRHAGGLDIAAMVGVILEAAGLELGQPENNTCKYSEIKETEKNNSTVISGMDTSQSTEELTENQTNEAKNVPVILDGLITAAAALVAMEIDQRVKDVVFFSHNGREKGISEVAAKYGNNPIIHADLALGEGTGAVMLMKLLECPLAVYHAGVTFEKSMIEAYRRYV